MILRPLLPLLFLGTSAFFAGAQMDIESLAKSEMKRLTPTLLYKKSLLTESYDVIYHRLELTVKLERKWIYGKVTTAFKPQKPAFNLLQFELENYLVVDSVVYKKKKLAFTHLNTLLTIQLASSVAQGKIDSVSVYYQGNPGLNNPHNSFVFDAHNTNDPHPIAWTLSEPYGAKGWWPCKESLTDKIDSLDVVLTVEKGNKGASNGLLIVEKAINDSQTIYHWRHRYPIVTYLVGIAVTNYVAYTDYHIYPDNDSLPIVNFVYPESEAVAKTKTPATVEFLKLFEKLFGEYPFKKEKYGHAQWNWGGGMEHQTMSFMVNYNYDLVAHELAHQWFGNWATCGRWGDLWLNEGFATYLNALCHEHLISQKAFENRMKGMRDDIVKEPGGSVFVNDTANRSRLFSGRLTYSKGAWVLHMLRWQLGDVAFYKGVNNYLKKNGVSYGSGTTEDLIGEMEKASGQDLTDFFKDWYYGEGYPIYDIQWSHVGNHFSLHIKQTPSHPSVFFYNIRLPFIIHGKGKDSAFVREPLTRDNIFKLDLDFIPESVELDPHVWILHKATILKVRPTAGPEIQIFPVPAGNVLSVYAYQSLIEKIKIYDMAGRLILSKDYGVDGSVKEAQEVNIAKLSSGLYIVNVETESGNAIQRFFKQ